MDAVGGGSDRAQAANDGLDRGYRLLKCCGPRPRRTALHHAPRPLNSADVLLTVQHAASMHRGSGSVWRQASVPGRVGASARHHMASSFDASASMRRCASESSPSVAGDPCNVYQAARAIGGAGAARRRLWPRRAFVRPLRSISPTVPRRAPRAGRAPAGTAQRASRRWPTHRVPRDRPPVHARTRTRRMRVYLSRAEELLSHRKRKKTMRWVRRKRGNWHLRK